MIKDKLYSFISTVPHKRKWYWLKVVYYSFVLMIYVGCSANINDFYITGEKIKNFWLKKKKARFMSPLHVRVKYYSLLISTLVRLFKVALLSKTLTLPSPPILRTWKVQNNIKPKRLEDYQWSRNIKSCWLEQEQK